MKKILVAVADYPNNNGGVALMYVHVRNKYYIQHDIDVTVLNFSSQEDYIIEGIKVISLATYERNCKQIKFDTLVLHAANLRNHYRFLKRYEKDFEKIVFFFHGHEVVKINEVYPEPYAFVGHGGKIRRILQNLYDDVKLKTWHKFLPMVAGKSEFVFVSNWLFSEFKKYVKLDEKDLSEHIHIINNSVGEVFEKNSYTFKGEKKFDFITIRSNIDSSTYCVDIICNLAKNNPSFSFLLIGKGNYFEVNEKPENLTWLNQYLTHGDMLNYINYSRCALMPTRRDTQGVMSCELVTYGIPLVTSDLPVCHEMFDENPMVSFVDNNDFKKIDLLEMLRPHVCVKSECVFGAENTIAKELGIL